MGFYVPEGLLRVIHIYVLHLKKKGLLNAGNLSIDQCVPFEKGMKTFLSI